MAGTDVSEGQWGRSPQPASRAPGSGASLSVPLCQTVGGWVGWGWGPPPPFSLCSVSSSQDGEGSVPVMLMCLFTLQPWETSVALVGRGWVLIPQPLLPLMYPFQVARQKGRDWDRVSRG